MSNQILALKSLHPCSNKIARRQLPVRSFASVKLPSIESITTLPESDKIRPIRKIQMYRAILAKAGFQGNEQRLRTRGLVSANAKHFDPHFKQNLREAAFQGSTEWSGPVRTQALDGLVLRMEVVADSRQERSPNHAVLTSSSGKALLNPGDMALLEFLSPASGTGPAIFSPYKHYHSARAGDFVDEILKLLNIGKTVVLHWETGLDSIRRYFSDMLSRAVFSHQELKFVTNALGNHFVQLSFEEAHNLFPTDDKDLTGVYARFAKEGAKFHIGMVYSTQSPSTINKELLAQTEYFFVAHLSSQDEARALSRVRWRLPVWSKTFCERKPPATCACSRCRTDLSFLFRRNVLKPCANETNPKSPRRKGECHAIWQRKSATRRIRIKAWSSPRNPERLG